MGGKYLSQSGKKNQLSVNCQYRAKKFVVFGDSTKGGQ